MEKYGIEGVELVWFKSYLSGRSQVVDISGAHSNPRDIDICHTGQYSGSDFIFNLYK
jgi:hypothetical protein